MRLLETMATIRKSFGASFDRNRIGSIQLLFLSVWVGVFSVSGCKKEPPPGEDSGVVLGTTDTGAVAPIAEEPALDAGEAPSDLEEPVEAVDAGEDAGTLDEPTTGIQTVGEQTFATAVGKVKKGRDISLSRDHAANVARKNLLKLLKDKGIESKDAKELKNATIKRFWVKGKFLYAEAVVELPAQPSSLNLPPGPPSNSAVNGPGDIKRAP